MFKSNIEDFFSHKYTKIKVNSDDDLPLEKMLNNVAILNRSISDRKHIHYYYHFFREMFIQVIYKMLYYERINISRSIDVNETGALMHYLGLLVFFG